MVWVKLWNRKHTLQHNLFGRFFWFLDNPYHIVKNLITVRTEKNKCDFYLLDKDWKIITDKLAKEVFRQDFLPKVLRRFQKDRRRFRQVALNLSRPLELKQLSNRELYRRYESLKKEYLRYTYFFWTPWGVNHKVVPWFERQLKKKFPQQYKALFRSVTIPTKRTLMDQQGLELLRYKFLGILNRKIAGHVKKYQWLGIYSLLDKPFKKEFFLHQIKDIKDPGKVLHDENKLLSEKKKSFQRALQRLKKYPVLLRIAKVLSEYAWLRTERVDVWREVLFLTQAFYRELDRRMKLKKNQATDLTYEEVVNFLKKNQLPDQRRIKLDYLVYLRHGRTKIIRDKKEAEKILKKELPQIDYSVIKQFKGLAACQGKVCGRVKIVMVPEDCRSMKPGNILVSNMTHPDYIFGIKIAGAIVTDEGGISSHAAIVSRELGIPCIIGTKIATKVLKDGDRVEVDANKGVVRIIK